MYVPILQPHVVPLETATHLPALPPAFSLSTFVCIGTLPAAAWARLIAHLHCTLAELRIVIVAHPDPSAAQLLDALALAAPRVERLELRLLIDKRVILPRMRPIFAALARLRTLRVEMPRCEAPAGIPLRTLTVRSAAAAAPPPEDIHRVMQLVECAQLRRLGSVRLVCFAICDEGQRALTEHWRARRVRFEYREFHAMMQLRNHFVGWVPTCFPALATFILELRSDGKKVDYLYEAVKLLRACRTWPACASDPWIHSEGLLALAIDTRQFRKLSVQVEFDVSQC